MACSRNGLNSKDSPDCDPNLCIRSQTMEPSTSSSSEQQFDSLFTKNRQARGSSLGAVSCLKYVEDFEILETLGKGFFGVVYKVREKRCNDSKSRSQPSIMVMKEPVINNTQSHLGAKKIVSREYYMLRLLKHPNILKTRGVCIQQNGAEWNLRLLVDYCDGGSVQEATLNLQKPFDWLERLYISLDVCRGMTFVHRSSFMHRDLTANNILLQHVANQRCRKAIVADFGLSCRIPKPLEIKQQVGTQCYMAPEVLSELFYNEKADVFSFGIVLCQMIARIDADHDAGLYRTSKFGLDYIRFVAHCSSDTPLNLLKTAFMCCLLAPTSRPSFETLLDQIQQIIDEDFPKGTNSFDSTRMGRSHSDATIRSVKTPSITTLNGRRSFRPDQLMIPEGVPVDDNFVMTPCELESRIKQLAETVAECDPDYQVSSLNPFASSDRYRSIRKIKPGDKYFAQREACFHTNDEYHANGSLSTTDKSRSVVKKHRRSVSMPCLFLDFPRIKDNKLDKTSKKSFTLGLGEQRDLQGRIVATFRDYDQKFNNISKSGILLSSNDLSRISNESLDKSILPNASDDEEMDSDLSDSASSYESFSPKGLEEQDSQQSCQNDLLRFSVSDNQITTASKNDESLYTPITDDKSRKSENGHGRKFLRRSSDECRIL